MKVVLDANIFISALFWGGNPRSVLERAINKSDDLFISKEILDEIEDVIGRPKFHAGKNEVEYYIKSIEEISNKVVPKNKIKKGSRDITDNKYIECAIAANADFIISGDAHLLELRKYRKIKIVSVKEYLELIQ
ncbi:MAG: putative toxin-antitoxin system toxin component, PIN family [Treponema sp.]|jgi:putative PIN family toxin of toxin-antitoxin system|nr:putative toxin-antitoxin system toxin component, PIN family [Treponema sp.]